MLSLQILSSVLLAGVASGQSYLNSSATATGAGSALNSSNPASTSTITTTSTIVIIETIQPLQSSNGSTSSTLPAAAASGSNHWRPHHPSLTRASKNHWGHHHHTPFVNTSTSAQATAAAVSSHSPTPYTPASNSTSTPAIAMVPRAIGLPYQPTYNFSVFSARPTTAAISYRYVTFPHPFTPRIGNTISAAGPIGSPYRATYSKVTAGQTLSVMTASSSTPVATSLRAAKRSYSWADGQCFGTWGCLPTTGSSTTVQPASTIVGYSSTSTSDSVTTTTAAATAAALSISTPDLSQVTDSVGPASAVNTVPHSLSFPQTNIPSISIVTTITSHVTSAFSVLSSPTSSGTTAQPTPCGEVGSFTLTWDDEPGFTPANNATAPYPPVFNPYHGLFFSNGYSYAPPPNDPFPPISPPHMAVFLPNASTTDIGSPDAAGNTPGEIGAGPHASNSTFWFSAYNAYVGCDNKGPSSCSLVVRGMSWDPVANVEQSLVNMTVTLDPCGVAVNTTCRLWPIDFEDRFNNLSGLQFEATANGSPVAFYMDNLSLGWMNNTCAAGLARQYAPQE